MAYTTVDSLFKGIADSVRAKTGKSGTIARQNLPSEIDSIQVGADKVVITDASYLFSGQIPVEAFNFFKVNKPTVMNHMFFQNDAIIDVDMTLLDFTPNPNAIALNNMFYTCDVINSVKLPNGIKAKSVMSMFQGCAKLTSIDLNGLDVTNCTDFRSFINGCRLLTEFDGSMLPNLSVANNNCQNFFYTTTSLKKVWIPKEWQVAPTAVGYALFIGCGGSNKNNTLMQVYTDAVSEEAQIDAGKWSNFTLAYSSTNAHIPAAQMHYGSTHEQYLNA